MSVRLPKLQLSASDESNRQTREVNKNLEARACPVCCAVLCNITARQTAQ